MKISQIIDRQLFSKDFGYYKTKVPIGKNADFITAPEISQIFGEIMAGYLLELSKNATSPISLVEMGAGKGTWLRDILRTISFLAQKRIPLAQRFVEMARFHIIEINPELKKLQQHNLRDYQIAWHEDFQSFANSCEGEIYFISNELFDCFAIDQFIKTDKGWQERLVDFDDKQNLLNPRYVIRNFDNKIHQFIDKELGQIISNQAPINSVFERSQSAQDFMKILCENLAKKGGIAINIDYGYFSYDFANTLQAMRNHQKIHFFEGLRDGDITAHVDFFGLDKIAKNFSLNSSLIAQKNFLLSLGAKERIDNLVQKNPTKADVIKSEFYRLIDENQMGNLFKVHMVWKQ